VCRWTAKNKERDDVIDFEKVSRVHFNSGKAWIQPQFIIPGVRRGELAVLAAAGATGKSYLGQMMGMSVATGVSVFPFLPVVRPYRVLSLQFEDLPEDVENRGNAILRAYPALDVGSLENFFCSACPGESLDLVNAESVNSDVVASFISYARDYDLIILDPLTNLWNECDENDAQAAMRLMKVLRRVAVECSAAVLICHHVNKNSLWNKRSDEQSAVRGSGAFVNAPRCVMTMAAVPKDEAPNSGGDSSAVALAWPKLNNHPLIGPVNLYRGWRGVLFMTPWEAEQSVQHWRDNPRPMDAIAY
jgi:RecA-family ATPase